MDYFEIETAPYDVVHFMNTCANHLKNGRDDEEKP